MGICEHDRKEPSRFVHLSLITDIEGERQAIVDEIETHSNSIKAKVIRHRPEPYNQESSWKETTLKNCLKRMVTKSLLKLIIHNKFSGNTRNKLALT